MRAPTAAALVLGIALLATACSSGPDPIPAADPAPATGTPTPAPQTPMDYHLPDDDAEAYPEWDQTSREQAAAAGDTVMRAFARPAAGVEDTAWREELTPLLTPSAQDAYAHVDPAEVPPAAVTGPAALLEPEPGATAYLATVQVPTDVGTYEVLLARTGGSTSWLAERISPPQSLTGPVTAPPPAGAPT